MAVSTPHLDDVRIAVLGLGYVGLPVAVAFGEQFPVVGYDIDPDRIAALKEGTDPSRELDSEALQQAAHLSFSSDPRDLADCNVFIVAVPTPVDAHKRPDLRHLEAASRTVGEALKSGDVVIYEATVYPGCTEEVCIPILEKTARLPCLQQAPESPQPKTTDTGPDGEQFGFHVGYSPERINPGDGVHSLRKVVKVTAGSTPEAAEFVDNLYRRIVDAGTHPVSSIAVAEAAKVIENTQRDLNIALVNELALIFNRLHLDTTEILEAAGSKWNFLPFRPGLVGGHCIGVDPYYLTYKAEATGYHPEVILAGRRINDGMGAYIAQRVIKLMTIRGIAAPGARVLVMGLAFKENCADLRNTRVMDIVREMAEYHLTVEVHDPWITPEAAKAEYGIDLSAEPEPGAYDAVILAVAHKCFLEPGPQTIRALAADPGILFDVKCALPIEVTDGRL